MRDQELGKAGMYQYRYTHYQSNVFQSLFRLVLQTIDR